MKKKSPVASKQPSAATSKRSSAESMSKQKKQAAKLDQIVDPPVLIAPLACT